MAYGNPSPSSSAPPSPVRDEKVHVTNLGHVAGARNDCGIKVPRDQNASRRHGPTIAPLRSPSRVVRPKNRCETGRFMAINTKLAVMALLFALPSTDGFPSDALRNSPIEALAHSHGIGFLQHHGHVDSHDAPEQLSEVYPCGKGHALPFPPSVGQTFPNPAPRRDMIARISSHSVLSQLLAAFMESGLLAHSTSYLSSGLSHASLGCAWPIMAWLLAMQGMPTVHAGLSSKGHGSEAMVGGDGAERGRARGEERRKSWSHTSSSFTERKYAIIVMYAGTIWASTLLYMYHLRAHVPPQWAGLFSMFVFIVGLLYDAQRANHLNEALAFLSGMTVLLVTRIVRKRTHLGSCECRLCQRELIVLSKLGEGSFGSIYLCRTTARAAEGRNVKCVVKRVPVDFDRDINDASEALQEAKSLIKLDHPHVVTCMDTWLHRQVPVSPFQPAVNEVCIMMEYCAKGDLFDRLERDRKEGKVLLGRLQTWCGQACEAVRYIHSKGITHCDLKLENFFLGEGDVVKLGDFGLSLQLKKRQAIKAPSSPRQIGVTPSRQPKGTEQNRTEQTGPLVPSPLGGLGLERGSINEWGSTKMGSRGTPDYMAPECWGSVSKYTAKVDVWSLGVIFYMMLTGKTPTEELQLLEEEGLEEDVYLGTIANGTAAEGRFDYFTELDRALTLVHDERWRAVIRRMLDPQPSGRPSVTNVVKDLNLNTLPRGGGSTKDSKERHRGGGVNKSAASSFLHRVAHVLSVGYMAGARTEEQEHRERILQDTGQRRPKGVRREKRAFACGERERVAGHEFVEKEGVERKRVVNCRGKGGKGRGGKGKRERGGEKH